MTSRMIERLKQLEKGEGDVSSGGSLSIWIPDTLVADLTTVADWIGISRSATARELLEIAVAEAMSELMPHLEPKHVVVQLAVSGKAKRPAKAGKKTPWRKMGSATGKKRVSG